MTYFGTHVFVLEGDPCMLCNVEVSSAATQPCRTRRVNATKSRYDVYVGRGGINKGFWGNPFRVGIDGTREEVVAKFATWIVEQPDKMAKIHELTGRVLGCWCDVDEIPCHADVLIQLADAVSVSDPSVIVPAAVSIDDFDKTLLILDTETTGTNTSEDRVIELCIQFGFDADEPAPQVVWRFNPERPIPAEASAIHHITDEMVAKEPVFKDFALRVADILGQASVLVGYNLSFDLNMLNAELVRAGAPALDLSKVIAIDALQLWRMKEPRTLSDAYRRFVGGELDNAHSAGADVRGTANVLLGMLEQFGLSGKYWDEIADVCNPERKRWVGGSSHFLWGEDAAEITVNFGKHKGKPVFHQDVRGYLLWVTKHDFPEHVKTICRSALKMKPADFYAKAREVFPPAAISPG